MAYMDVKKFFISPDVSIREAIRQLDETAKKLLLVVEDGKLVGVVTDGDIRRWILKNQDLSQAINFVMNSSPISITKSEVGQAFNIMKEKGIEGLPLLDENKQVLDILFWNELGSMEGEKPVKKEVPVVIMAGGKGSRLYPYTKIIPKPLIPIGDTPIVERIMNQMISFGFIDFYLTVNYRKELIKAYFNDDNRYHLSFVEEKEPLGTAGALTLLKDKITGSFFVSNCDILVDVNYEKLLYHHNKSQNQITVITAMKNYEIPYGVVSLDDGGRIQALNEKPNYEFLVSTGLYVLERDVLDLIPEDIPFDMPDLIRLCLKNGNQVGAYPVMDSTWLDMGEFSEMKKMAERMKV
jgi:dTDP-glucose pyrophosphorylase/predicted transcriptional regulator